MFWIKGIKLLLNDFVYKAPRSLNEALKLIREEDAKVLAGGHSLIPLMKLGFASPESLIDIGKLEELQAIEETNGVLTVGSCVSYRVLFESEMVKSYVPLLSKVASQVGDPQVRARGTVGGSLVHGDPASDIAGAILALDATVELVSLNGKGDIVKRKVPAREFFVGFLETVIEDDEILHSISFKNKCHKFSFQKITRREQDWAIVGVAVAQSMHGIGIGLVNLASKPVYLDIKKYEDISELDPEGVSLLLDSVIDPPADIYGDAEYRRHLAEVLLLRCLKEIKETT